MFGLRPKCPATTLLRVVSALVLLSAAMAWVRSLGHSDEVHWYHVLVQSRTVYYKTLDAYSWKGGLGASLYVGQFPWQSGSHWHTNSGTFFCTQQRGGSYPNGFGVPHRQFWFGRGAFSISFYGLILVHDRSLNIPGNDWKQLTIPYWLFAICSAAPLFLACLRWRTRIARQRRGECLQCGYDLRCQNDRCPECGAFVGKNQKRGASEPPLF
jgi:hypothetical protein